MNAELLFVLGLLAACVVMFVFNKPRMDIVALLVIVILPLSGIVTLPEALAGFSDTNILLIAALFVMGAGLSRTGIAFQVSDLLVKKAGSSEMKLLALLMCSVALLGSVMSSTGVVAIFIPVALSLASHLKIPPGRLMMPLSVAGLISGMMTLVGTAPNMVIDGALQQAGFGGLAFFSFTPVGLVVLVAGVGYMLFARHWLTTTEPDDEVSERRTMAHFIEDYGLAGREFRLRVLSHSSFCGKTLSELRTTRQHHSNVVAIERQGRLRTEFIEPVGETIIFENDVLLVDHTPTQRVDPLEMAKNLGLEVLPLQGQYFTDRSRDVGMAEILIPPDSGLIGKSLVQDDFRSKHRLCVIGVRRNNRALEGPVAKRKLRSGDTLLVVGTWRAIRALSDQPGDFLVLSIPSEIDQAAPAKSQAPFALLSLGVMIFLMVSGFVPNVIAALIGCLMMGLFRCIDMDTAYRSIHWNILLLIVGVMPFGIALERTGGIELAVNGLLALVGEAGPRVVLGSLFVLTALIGLFISNTATAVLMAPIALSTASHLGASPYPFAMTVAIAASAAFMTPISSPVNTLVLGPGRYSFGDFAKIGVPFTIVVLLICVLLVPVLFPLYP